MVMPVPVPVWMITVAGPDSNGKPQTCVVGAQAEECPVGHCAAWKR